MPEGSTETTDKKIEIIEKCDYLFAGVGVSFSCEFPGGRISDVIKENDAIYRVVVSPENFPINDSAWYAFSVASEADREVQIILEYRNGTHRYHPKLSKDGRSWRTHSAEVNEIEGVTEFKFPLRVSDAPIFVSAQELVVTDHIERWVETLSERRFVSHASVGKTPAGNDLFRIRVGAEAADGQVVVVVGRQHPPEVTGSIALMAFVDEVASDSKISRDFRKQFGLVVYPLANPDGVDLGHWRHNRNGVDLNRDWKNFNQPETNLIRLDVAAQTLGSVAFFLDFHSTHQDIVYLVEGRQQDSRNPEMAWLELFGASTAKFRPIVQPIPAESAVAMSWFSRTYEAPAITYEVGDTTSRSEVERVAREAARTLMIYLLGSLP